MSEIRWLVCPKCTYRFYIVAEHADQGFEWFCPKCKHAFREDDMERAGTAAKGRG